MLRVLSTKGLNKLYIPKMEYHSAKSYNLLIYPKTWISRNYLEERSQIQKSTLCVIPFIWSSKVKLIYGDRGWKQPLLLWKPLPLGRKGGTTWGTANTTVSLGWWLDRQTHFQDSSNCTLLRSVHFSVCTLFLDLKYIYMYVKKSQWKKSLVFLSLIRKHFTKSDTWAGPWRKNTMFSGWS